MQLAIPSLRTRLKRISGCDGSSKTGNGGRGVDSSVVVVGHSSRICLIVRGLWHCTQPGCGDLAKRWAFVSRQCPILILKMIHPSHLDRSGLYRWGGILSVEGVWITPGCDKSFRDTFPTIPDKKAGALGYMHRVQAGVRACSLRRNVRRLVAENSHVRRDPIYFNFTASVEQPSSNGIYGRVLCIRVVKGL